MCYCTEVYTHHPAGGRSGVGQRHYLGSDTSAWHEEYACDWGPCTCDAMPNISGDASHTLPDASHV